MTPNAPNLGDWGGGGGLHITGDRHAQLIFEKSIFIVLLRGSRGAEPWEAPGILSKW